MKHLVNLLLMALFGLGAAPLFAQQTAFTRTVDAQGATLGFRWLDHTQQSRQLTIVLSAEARDLPHRTAKNYQPDVVQRYIYVALMKHARQIDPKEARVTIRPVGDRLEIQVTSRDPLMISKWQLLMQQQQQQVYEQFLQENYFTRFETFYGATAIRPDHIRYLKEALPALRSVAVSVFEQVGEGHDSRQYVNFLLSMIQTIPYDELEDKNISRGSGYLAPLEVLMSNVGDCDSKTTLMAGILRELFPTVSMAIIYLPNHALLAINLPHRSSEESIEIDGGKYLLVDPTGPALMPAGEISLVTRQQINSGMYSYQKVPRK